MRFFKIKGISSFGGLENELLIVAFKGLEGVKVRAIYGKNKVK